MSLMYEDVETYNPFIGCEFDCSYCYARRMAKRRKGKCEKCYNFVPHMHPERLNKKFQSGAQIFVCSMGDISFASPMMRHDIYNTIENNLDTTFLVQSKNPSIFVDDFNSIGLPHNAIYGTTVETNIDLRAISKAPHPIDRLRYLSDVSIGIGRKVYVTIEPCIRICETDNRFDAMLSFVERIKFVKPVFVYLGLDNHFNHLNEPPLDETRQLIKYLREFTDIRQKTIRNAWWER